MAWPDQVSAALASPVEATVIPIDTLEVIARFPADYALATAADELQGLDRAVRWAVRAAEDGVDLEELWRRPVRPVGREGGLLLAGLESGSVLIQGRSSSRMQRALDATGVRLVLAICTLLGGITATEGAIEEPSTTRDGYTLIRLGSGPKALDVQVPPEVSFRLRRGSEIVEISVSPQRP